MSGSEMNPGITAKDFESKQILYFPDFSSLNVRDGARVLWAFSTTMGLANLKVAVCLKSFDEAPTLTRYVPASATHDEDSVLKDARLRLVITNVICCDSPGFSRRVLANPLSSSAGLSSEDAGALR
jgi:hypothetical protein